MTAEEHEEDIEKEIAVGIIEAVALAGFIISGGDLPNSQNNQPIPAGTEPVLLHG
jgi:hypothetical protein